MAKKEEKNVSIEELQKQKEQLEEEVKRLKGETKEKENNWSVQAAPTNFEPAIYDHKKGEFISLLEAIINIKADLEELKEVLR